MTETATPPTTALLDQADIPPAAGEGFASGQSGAVSFAELVRIHFDWERALRRGVPDDDLEQRFRQKLEEFQAAEGRLLNAYWSRRRASAVALTVRPRRRFRGWRVRRWRIERGRFPRPDDPFTEPDAVIRLHRATDWLAREAPIANLMHHCDTLGIRVGEVLRGTSERIAMQWIFAVQSHLLGFVERTEGKASEEQMAEIQRSQTEELLEIEKYYARAGGKIGRVVYFSGMMAGALLSAFLAVLLALALWLGGWFEAPYVRDMQAFFVSYAAGGIGAIVSVMSRMATGDKFNLDYEVGRPTIRRLGAFRPFVGAIFGVAMFFLISSGLPQVQLPENEEAFFYFGTVAFLAGFIERRTGVIFGSAEAMLEKSLGMTTATDEERRTETQVRIEGDSVPPADRRRTVTTETVTETFTGEGSPEEG